MSASAEVERLLAMIEEDAARESLRLRRAWAMEKLRADDLADQVERLTSQVTVLRTTRGEAGPSTDTGDGIGS
jgi:hypothetical protein